MYLCWTREMVMNAGLAEDTPTVCAVIDGLLDEPLAEARPVSRSTWGRTPDAIAGQEATMDLLPAADEEGVL